MNKSELKYIAAGGAVALLLLVMLKKKLDAGVDVGGFFQEVGEETGGAVVDFVDGAIGGVVGGVGDVVGVPRTDMTECERAMAEGRLWDASFDCPAGTFIKYGWGQIWD